MRDYLNDIQRLNYPFRKYKGHKYHPVENDKGFAYLCGCMPSIKLGKNLLDPVWIRGFCFKLRMNKNKRWESPLPWRS